MPPTGINVRIIERLPYDFSKLQGSQSQTIILARKINVVGYREATFYVRIHSGSSMSGLTALQFNVFADGFTNEDPAAMNNTSTLPAFLTTIGSAVDLHGNGPGDMKIIRVDTTTVSPPGGFGSMLAIAITATQPASPVSGLAWLSIDLSLKD